MCLLFIANNVNKNYKLILAANRDEFYNRQTEQAHFWEEHPKLLAGKDLNAGGTWLGITRSGRIAAITNYRDLKNINPNAPSRGKLVSDFLLGNQTPEEYYNSIENDAPLYNGFNLIFGEINNLYYFSNYAPGLRKLESGSYGLSNCLLDTPWPKVENVKKSLSELVKEDVFNEKRAFNILYNTDIAPDELLPDTGVGLELERILSSVFIKSPVYGTRCSTILLIDSQDNITFIEKTYLPENNKFSRVDFNFRLD